MVVFDLYLSPVSHQEPFLVGIFFLRVHSSKNYRGTTAIHILTPTGHTRGIQKPACGGNKGQVRIKGGFFRTSTLSPVLHLPTILLPHLPIVWLLSTFYHDTSLFYSRSRALPRIEGFLLCLLLTTLSCCLCPLSHPHTNQTYELPLPLEKNATYRLASALFKAGDNSEVIGCWDMEWRLHRVFSPATSV